MLHCPSQSGGTFVPPSVPDALKNLRPYPSLAHLSPVQPLLRQKKNLKNKETLRVLARCMGPRNAHFCQRIDLRVSVVKPPLVDRGVAACQQHLQPMNALQHKSCTCWYFRFCFYIHFKSSLLADNESWIYCNTISTATLLSLLQQHIIFFRPWD